MLLVGAFVSLGWCNTMVTRSSSPSSRFWVSSSSAALACASTASHFWHLKIARRIRRVDLLAGLKKGPTPRLGRKWRETHWTWAVYLVILLRLSIDSTELWLWLKTQGTRNTSFWNTLLSSSPTEPGSLGIPYTWICLRDPLIETKKAKRPKTFKRMLFKHITL